MGQIWCAAMMLEHLGFPEAGDLLMSAMKTALERDRDAGHRRHVQHPGGDSHYLRSSPQTGFEELITGGRLLFGIPGRRKGRFFNLGKCRRTGDLHGLKNINSPRTDLRGQVRCRRRPSDEDRFYRPGDHGKADGEKPFEGGGTVWWFSDANAAPMKELAAAGAETAASPKEVAEKCDIVVTMLPNSPHVKAVVLGAKGIIEGAYPGKTVIDMSSIAPLASRRSLRCWRKKGWRCSTRR